MFTVDQNNPEATGKCPSAPNRQRALSVETSPLCGNSFSAGSGNNSELHGWQEDDQLKE